MYKSMSFIFLHMLKFYFNISSKPKQPDILYILFEPQHKIFFFTVLTHFHILYLIIPFFLIFSLTERWTALWILACLITSRRCGWRAEKDAGILVAYEKHRLENAQRSEKYEDVFIHSSPGFSLCVSALMHMFTKTSFYVCLFRLLQKKEKEKKSLV